MNKINIALGDYIRRTGRTITWTAKKANELGCKSINEKKLSSALLGNRNLSADEFLYVCKAIEVSPDRFMERNETA